MLYNRVERKMPMKRRRRLKILWNILRHTKADKILFSFLLFVLADAALIWGFEPTITTYRDALWYCYAVISTAGFGDLVVTAFVPKILSILLTVYSMLALAIITGVVVNYYTQMMELKNKDTIVAFLDKLEELPDLSREELVDLSERIKRFRGNP